VVVKCRTGEKMPSTPPNIQSDLTDEDRGQYYVHWMKDNRSPGAPTSVYRNSHQRVSAAELPVLIKIFENLFREVDSTHYRDTLPRLKNSIHAALTDRCDPDYWDDSLADRLPSETLIIRYVQQKDGSVIFKILAPKSSQANLQWNGICVSLTRGCANKFVEQLKRFYAEIERENQR
jgi:hypothetical protein